MYPSNFNRLTNLCWRHFLQKNNNNGADYDGLSMFIFKYYYHHLPAVMTRICISSLFQGKIPSKLSFANVTCIFKEGNAQIRSNYKPICVLPLLCKNLEKVVKVQLAAYLESNELLTPHDSVSAR